MAGAPSTMMPRTKPFQLRAEGKVRWVQVIPSGEVAAMFDLAAAMTKTAPFQNAELQFWDEGRVRCVHEVPLLDVAQMFPPEAMAT